MNRTRLLAAGLSFAVAVFVAAAAPYPGDGAPTGTAVGSAASGDDAVPPLEVAETHPGNAVTVTPGGDEKVSIDVQGAEIRTVLRSLQEYSGRNIVADEDVTGTVSVKLVDVPWRQALQAILRAQKLDYVEEGGIIRVGVADQLRAEQLARQEAERKADELLPLVTQLVRVDFANATEMQKAVAPVLSKRGHIEVDERTNSLLITDIEANVETARDLVHNLDAQTPQIEIVAKLVDVDASVAQDIGVKWNVTGLHSNKGAVSASGSVDAQAADATGNVTVGVVRNWAAIDAQIQMLEDRKKANIISNPKITTADNREARIIVGQEIPLIVLDQAGNPVTQLKQIGIELRVTPHINSDERITLDVHPTVSDLSSQATVQGGVIINTTEADTRVLVRNGETAVIGGLIRSNVSQTHHGVPFLQSIPILGYLFRSTSTSDQKRELLIFVTPTIVTSM